MSSLFRAHKEKLEPLSFISKDNKINTPHAKNISIFNKGSPAFQNQQSNQIPQISQLTRSNEDFEQTDYDDRNILHRAALDQQQKLLKDVLTEIQSRNLNVKDYINKQDKFQLTPALLCCIRNRPSNKSKTNRFKCLRKLFKFGANLHSINPRTLWSCMHWASHYGDRGSVTLLIEKQVHAFLPDYQGQYPIDLAGHAKFDSVVLLLLEHCVEILIKFLQMCSGTLSAQDPLYQQLSQFTEDREAKHLMNPVFRSKLLYWAAMYKANTAYYDLLKLGRCYFLAPFTLEGDRTALHAACFSGNKDFIEKALNSLVNPDVKEAAPIQISKLKQNSVFCFTDEELEIYKKEFKEQVLAFANWEFKFLVQKNQYKRNAFTYRKIQPNTYVENFIFIDYQDHCGNSALHVASLKGYEKIVTLLLDNGADMNLENNELFKARELTQHDKVLNVYLERGRKEEKPKILALLNDGLKESLLQMLDKKQQLEEMLLLRGLNDKLQDKDYRELLQKFNSYSQELFVPDFIIRCKLDESSLNKSSLESTPYFFELKSTDDSNLARLNFQISLLQSAKFQIFLMKSQFEQGVHYIMIQHTEKELEEQAELMDLQVKLMDSYDLEEFQKQFQDLFEPFRSRQRQQIIENHLRRIINLNELQRMKIVETFYRMHKSGGINKIKSIWIDNSKWYFPQPINQIKDYLSEGQQQNFYSITVLRLYFGEKISFFFAWKSYITCALMTLAIPGAVIQLYILIKSEYFPNILPFWVCYVCLWSTLQVEFWKRKNYEITTRWGCLDLMEEKHNNDLCKGFTGYEEIYQVTGELTKHQKKSETFLKVCLSILVLSFFLAMCIGIFVGVDYLVVNYSKGNFYITIGLNICQGVGIFILNIVYTLVAKGFAIYENHKYQVDYEGSLIYKNSAFKFINSYLSIFYAAFYKDNSTLESLFQLLLPVLIVKQVNYVAFKVLLPQLIYRYQEKKYFSMQKLNINRQQQLNKEGFMDRVEELYNYVFKNLINKEKLKSSKRAVLKVGAPENPPEIESNIDTDQVELNNLKLDFEGTLDYFMEGIIDLGYITLFAAAFPIGPAIAVCANMVEIRMKILSFIEVYKRPECERCAGIGEWLNVMNYMGTVSVFTNFALLFIKQKENTINALFGYSGNQNDSIIWLYFFTIALILILKYFFSWIIPDTPEWVVNELEKMNEKQHINTGQREALRKAENKLIEEQKKSEQIQKDADNQNKFYSQEILNRKDTLIRLNDQISRYAKQSETEKKLQLKDKETIQQISQIYINSEQFKKIRIGLMRMIYIEIEHSLILKRLFQIDQARIGHSFLCQNCQLKEAIFECEECEENFCGDCYYQSHKKQQHIVMLLKKLKFYDPQIIKSMKIKRLKKPTQKQPVKCQIIEQEQEERKRWQKIQNFCFPVLRQSNQYSALPKIFKLFYSEYMNQLEQEYVTMAKLYKFKKVGNSFQFYPSQNIIDILELTELNIEEKMWLNRIAFFCCKKGYKYDEFYNYCKTLQNGELSVKIQLIIDLADINNDGFVNKAEIEQMFLSSFVQDTQQSGKIQNIMNTIFMMQTYTKEQAFQYIIQCTQDPNIKSFIQALVQNEQ